MDRGASTTGTTSWRLRVGGHDWLVRERPGAPGCYDVDRLSGPDPGYGFSSQTSNRAPIGEADMTRCIADFLAEIDPETGHLD